jgi:hypothetical protein
LVLHIIVVLRVLRVVLRVLRRVVDGDEGGCTADHFGRGDRDRARDGDGRTLGAGLIGAGVLGIGASNVGALVSHGTLAIAATVVHGVAVLVGARDTWVYLVGVPRLLLIEIRGRRGNISGAILHRQVVEVHGIVLAVARPAVLERGGATSVIKLLEAIVEAHTHAAVDTEVVV